MTGRKKKSTAPFPPVSQCFRDCHPVPGAYSRNHLLVVSITFIFVLVYVVSCHSYFI